MPMIPNYAWTSAAAEDLSGRFGGEYDRTRIKGVGFDGIIVPIKRSGTGIPRRFLAGMMKTAKDHPEVVPVIGGIDERNGRWAMRIGFVHRDKLCSQFIINCVKTDSNVNTQVRLP